MSSKCDRFSEVPVLALSGVVDTCSISTGDGRIWVGRGFVAVITDATQCPADSDPIREGKGIKFTEIACTLQPVTPGSTMN